MSEAPSSYRAFQQEANRIILSGLKNVRTEQIAALVQSARSVPSESARAQLKQLVEQYPRATGTARTRLVLKTLASCFQSFSSSTPLPRVPLDRFARSSMSASILVETPPAGAAVDLVLAARGRINKFQALTLLSRSPEILRLPPSQLHPVLTNSDLAPALLAILGTQDPARRLTLATDLSGRSNMMLRHAAVRLSESLAFEERCPVLVRALAEPRLARDAERQLVDGGAEGADRLIAELAGSDAARRVQLLKVLRRFTNQRPCAQLRDLAAHTNPAMAFWARLVLHSWGDDHASFLLEAATDPHHHQQRIFAKLALVKSGSLKDRNLAGELEGDNQLSQAYAAEAVLELDNATELIEPLISGLSRSGDKEARLSAVKRLVLFDDPRFHDLLREAARDPFPEIRKRAIARLVALRGFAALEEYFDLGPVLTRSYDELTVAQHQYLLFHVIPLLRHVPDIRFARYLARLTSDSLEKGGDFDFEVNLKPVLVAFGEALAADLGELAASTSPHVSMVAEELLLAIGSKDAKDLVARARANQDPLSIAFRNLQNATLKDQARRDLVAAGKAAVNVVLPGLVDPELRADVCWILGKIGDPSALPHLFKLLGQAGDLQGAADTDTLMRPRYLDGPVSMAIMGFGPRAVRGLRPLVNHPDWSVRSHAAYLLGRMGDHESAPVVRTLLEDGNLDVIVAGMEAVGLLRDEDAVPHLGAYLKSEHMRLFACALQALSDISSPECLPILDEALASQKELPRRRLIQTTLARLRERSTAATGKSAGELTERIKALFRKGSE